MITLTAADGAAIPGFIYGTAWKEGDTARLVQLAVAAGFRAIDTANQPVHYNEPAVGEALRALQERGIGRDALFLQTKFTPLHGHDHRVPYDGAAPLPEQVRQSFERSLKQLGTETVDSYLLHGPYGRRGLGEDDWAVWGAIEEIYRSGRAKRIGISNVNAGQLRELCERAAVKPMVVQNRCYAVTGWDREVRDVCAAHQVIYQGFSLLTANQALFRHPAVAAIAARLGIGPPQVIFRFARQIGMLPLTGTTSESHMREDLSVERLVLTNEELATLETIAA